MKARKEMGRHFLSMYSMKLKVKFMFKECFIKTLSFYPQARQKNYNDYVIL